MTLHVRRLFSELTRRQHGVAAVWQLLEQRLPRTAVDRWIRDERPERVHRGVYGTAHGNLGHVMAAALAAGPKAAVSGHSGLALWAMRPWSDQPFCVSVPGSGGCAERDGFRVHRTLALEVTSCLNIPVNTPTRCLLDAALPRHEAYRALEAAEQARLRIEHAALDTPALREVREVLRLGLNPTRSDAEARFIFLCRDHGIEMPLVNSRLNGVEADFHWPRAGLVVEVDGWKHHRERTPFEEDRRRGVAHRIGGYEVIRVSASQVRDTPDAVVAAVLAAAPYLRGA